jgi:hypothetical protein
VKIRFFPDIDSLCIALAERASASSEAISHNLIVDFDATGEPEGVTLDHCLQPRNHATSEAMLAPPTLLSHDEESLREGPWLYGSAPMWPPAG